MGFLLTTDTSCDVFRGELEESGIPYIPLTYTIDNATEKDEFRTDEQYLDFYKKILSGAMPVTSQINAFLHEEFFDKLLESRPQTDIVHLTLSSGLSATYSSACTGAENAMKKHPGSKIFVVDTLAATQGHRLLLDRGRELRDGGKSAEEAAEHLHELKNRLHHWVLVDDLMHLKRGGRVSGVAAYLGTMLNLKPVLVVDQLGKLSVVQKVKGLKRGLKLCMEMLDKHGRNIDGGKIYIASANCHEIAESLKAMILEKYNCTVIIGWIGPVIGAHTGNNTLGLVFESTRRIESKQ